MVVSPAILGIETSCDETGAAVMTEDGCLLSNVLDSQIEVHAWFGGVVPELASRRHLEKIEVVVRQAMENAQRRFPNLQAIAVTNGPGLAGSLLVGVNFGKSLAYAAGIPLLAINHLEGHLATAWLGQSDFSRPAVMLVVSGGHTHLYLATCAESYQLLGRTLDDAAGEAFDKGAKMLGLPYPGGPAIDRLAGSGDPTAIHFPRPCLKRSGFNFSFSGLKTSLLYYLRDLGKRGEQPSVENVAASYQEAIVDVLVEKSFRAVRHYHVTNLAVVGGVSANSRFRYRLNKRAEEMGIRLALPPVPFCTDNAAMIAAAGWTAFRSGNIASWDLDLALGMSQKELGSSSAVCLTSPGGAEKIR